MTLPKFYTPEEVAGILKVNPKTVLRWIREGKLKAVKAGRLWRVREEDLEAFLSPEEEAGGQQGGYGNRRGSNRPR